MYTLLDKRQKCLDQNKKFWVFWTKKGIYTRCLQNYLLRNFLRKSLAFKDLPETYSKSLTHRNAFYDYNLNKHNSKLEIGAHVFDIKNGRDAIDEQAIKCINAARDKILKHYNNNNSMYYVVLILDPFDKLETFSLQKLFCKLKQLNIQYQWQRPQ